jgi:DUF4097 and DUF4098 domain-containing protein YvlB
MARRWFVVPILFSFGFLTGCGMGEWGDSNRYQADFHESHPMKSGDRLYLENLNGSVEITGGEQQTADISGTKYASTEAILDAMKIDVVASGDSIRIRTIRPSGHVGNLGARYVIRVPRGARLERIQSSNGSLRIRDIDSAARLETSNGAIEVTSVGGPVTMHTSNGAIRADGVERGIEGTTSNGSIRVVLGKVEERRPVRLTTSNGSVELAVDDLGGSDVVVHTSNASITARLPQSVAADVKVSTSNGGLTNEFESSFHGRAEKQSLDGTIGGGGPLLSLSTSNGSIRLLKR